jgi:hypothetical protein
VSPSVERRPQSFTSRSYRPLAEPQTIDGKSPVTPSSGRLRLSGVVEQPFCSIVCSVPLSHEAIE